MQSKGHEGKVATANGSGGEEELPELALHHIVLGRYGGMKTKPLSEPIKVYKEFRERIRRSELYGGEDIKKIRWEITRHIRKELNLPSLPLVEFVVDIKKIQKLKDTGKLPPELAKANPKTFRHKNPAVTFVEDETFYFFKQELKENNRSRSAKLNEKCRPASSLQKGKFTRPPLNMITPKVPARFPYGPAPLDSSSHRDGTSTLPTETEMDWTMDPPSLQGLTINSNHQKLEIMNMDLIQYPSDYSGSASVFSGISMDRSADSKSPPRFEFVQSSNISLEQQVEKFCANWIHDINKNDLDGILRKTTMVTSFRSYFQRFQELLLSNNPFVYSVLPTLRDLCETLLIDSATVLLNTMIQAYDRHPSSCLEGEANDWTGNHGNCDGSMSAFQSHGSHSGKKRKQSLPRPIHHPTPDDDTPSMVTQQAFDNNPDNLEPIAFGQTQQKGPRSRPSPVARGASKSFRELMRQAGETGESFANIKLKQSQYGVAIKTTGDMVKEKVLSEVNPEAEATQQLALPPERASLMEEMNQASQNGESKFGVKLRPTGRDSPIAPTDQIMKEYKAEDPAPEFRKVQLKEARPPISTKATKHFGKTESNKAPISHATRREPLQKTPTPAQLAKNSNPAELTMQANTGGESLAHAKLKLKKPTTAMKPAPTPTTAKRKEEPMKE